tara:strand:- start:215 stop:670 length:456 start_codon:yes stop_codon:yes gene_type:complete
METIVVFLIGLATGVLLVAKPEVLRNLHPTAFAYSLLGLALFGASYALSWVGFTCVLSAFVLYHAIGRDGWSQAIRTFFSFQWLKRKPKETAEQSGDGPPLERQRPEAERPNLVAQAAALSDDADAPANLDENRDGSHPDHSSNQTVPTES